MNNDTKEISANELADYLDENVEAMFACEQVHIDEAATMLRQQQAEVEALKMMLANRNEALDKLDLKSTPCKYTEGM